MQHDLAVIYKGDVEKREEKEKINKSKKVNIKHIFTTVVELQKQIL